MIRRSKTAVLALFLAASVIVPVSPAAGQGGCFEREGPLPDYGDGSERVAYDHFLGLLSKRDEPDVLSASQLEQMRSVAEIIWNEQELHPCLRYLRRLPGATGYAAFAISKRDADKTLRVLNLNLITRPEEPIRPVSEGRQEE